MSKYTEADVRKALAEVNRGSSISAAAVKYGIPRTTLSGKHHHVYPIEIRKGPSTILTEEEEKHLEKWIFHLSDSGFAIVSNQLLDSVQHLVKELKRGTPFTDGRPGRKWYEGFMRRHPEVQKKLSRNLSHPRVLVTQENIRNWFTEVGDYLTKEHLWDVINDPNRVFNMDESAFFLCPKGERVLVRKSSKMVYNFVNNDDKECLTALIGGNAAGKLMPSMVVYAHQRVPAVISQLFPKTWALGRSDNGWMTSETFYEYIANIFHPWLLKENIKLPIVLFVDGHSSHGTLHLSEFCQKNKIVLVALYPNATHFLQPMDVSCFHPLKVGWKKGVRKWRFDNDGAKLKRENFAPLLEKVIRDTIKPETVINGFRKCGLHPFTPEAINFKEMMVRSTAQEPNSNVNSEVQRVDDIDYQLFLNWIEKSISTELLHSFRVSDGGWGGNVVHTSLFEFWQKHFDLAQTSNVNTGAGTFIGQINQKIHQEQIESLPESEEVLTIDYESIPTIDLEDIENVSLEDIVVIDNYQHVSLQNQSFSVDKKQFFPCSEPVGEADESLSSEDEINECDSSDTQDNDDTSDDDTAKAISSIDGQIDTEEEIADHDSVASNQISHSQNVGVAQQAIVDPQDPSHIPPNTPAAFAKVLFYPTEKHLSGKNKRLQKKRKIPAVYTSVQYSEYLKEKERVKEELEKRKMQRKSDREEAKQRKKEEKMEREAKRSEKKEAMAIKRAELASKKEAMAKKKAEIASRKAGEAVKKADSKESRVILAPSKKKRKIEACDNKIDPPQNDCPGA